MSWLVTAILALACFHLASTFGRTGRDAPVDRLRGQPEPVFWTSAPLKIGPEMPRYPRIADAVIPAAAFPIILPVPGTVRTLDNRTFIVEGTTYVLANIRPLAADAVCSRATGARWACGLRTRLELRRKLAGSVLQCRRAGRDPLGPAEVECLRAGELLDIESVEPPAP